MSTPSVVEIPAFEATEHPVSTRRLAGRRRPLAVSIVIAVGLALFIVVALFPFLWIVRTALTPAADAFSLTPSLLPSGVTLDNLLRVITNPNVPFVRYFANSCIVAFATTALVLLLGSWGAYALARLEFRGRQSFGLALLFIQMFPGILTIIPLFIIFTRLHLVNNFAGLIVAYTTGALPFSTWLLRSYFLSISAEMEDAARIDGCTRLGTLFRIVLPLSVPGLAAVATLAFVHAWNEFFFAYVLIDDDTKKVLSIGLASYVQQFTTDYGGLFAMALLTSLPVVIVFMVFQRYLVGGLTTGSLKG